MSALKYRKKPVEIEAEHLSSLNGERIAEWINANGGTARYLSPNDGDPNCPDRTAHSVRRYCPSCAYVVTDPAIAIDTLEGTMTANVGDWVIRGVAGEFYPCRDDIFATTYERVDS